jgi:8-oxo-dGTP pyrophosphatase MutT (NUDIX family)
MKPPQPLSLQAELTSLLTPDLFLTNYEYKNFTHFVEKAKLIRYDNSQYHCDVMFVPINPITKKIFIVHHKKAKQWILPGGHIEQNELLEDALKREIREELGITVEKIDKPFLLSVISIHNEGYLCKAHYDVWFVLPATEVNPDPREFNETKWASKKEALQLITHQTYLKAIARIPIDKFLSKQT